ncbi:MAG: hypothetical protein MI723_12675, partial [Caulobacterales bacterium]|nr:hypothetical protein [Caulobacterales bacterium]
DPNCGRFIDTTGRERLGPCNEPKGVADTAHERLFDVLRKAPPCFDVFGLTRRAIMARTHLHGTWYGSDRAFMAEMALHGKLHAVPEVLFLNREHPGQSIALSRTDQARWIGPHKRSRMHPGLNLAAQLAAAIVKSPLSVPEKARCLRVVFERKWNHNPWKPALPATDGAVSA